MWFFDSYLPCPFKQGTLTEPQTCLFCLLWFPGAWHMILIHNYLVDKYASWMCTGVTAASHNTPADRRLKGETASVFYFISSAEHMPGLVKYAG